MHWKLFNIKRLIKIELYTYGYVLTTVNHPDLFKKNVMHL